MTDVFDAIFERRSSRKFTGKTVSYDQLKVIANAGLRAPTINDLRNIQFVLVNDGRDITTMSDNSNEQTWIKDAGGLIGVVANEDRLDTYHDTDTPYSHEHVGAAVQNMLLAAHALELGACWVADYDPDPVERVFSAGHENDFDEGEDESLLAVVVIGYPEDSPKEKPAYHPQNHIFFDEFEERLQDHKYMRGQYYEQLQKVGYNLAKDTRSAIEPYEKLWQRVKDLFR